MTLEEMIQKAIDDGNTALAEQLQQLNPGNNQELAKCKVNIQWTLEKFDGEKQLDSQPVETIVINE